MHSEQSELGELPDQVLREVTALEPVADVREYLLSHELPHGVPKRALLVLQQPVDPEEVEGVEGGELGGRRRHRPTSYGEP